ncbi:hypothetical protein MOQ72_02615 [Saccharopolyspora sp. K220]|uniref:hypothetical protein n=1 Tax=Saccharopolyspora soli TaxID=2926618 RepID=UPI001F55FA6B|nr:hypothetical protein [Saccharopolyspora soli]MCI2416303.1 hypothetical protein [Saccharopolyspora soli]
MLSIPPTRFFYAGAPQAIVSLHPTADGIGVSITWPCDDDKPGAACLMSLTEFRELIEGSTAVLALAEELHTSKNQKALFTEQEGEI